MDKNEKTLMEHVETEVATLNADVNKVRAQVSEVQVQVSGVQAEMTKVKAGVTGVQTDVKEILNILSGNKTVHGDHGITGRLFEVEKRMREMEEWKVKHADFVVDDHKSVRRRVDSLEKSRERSKIYLAVWGGVATFLAFILQIVLKYFFKL